MNTLQILENGLIPVYKSEKGDQLVNARELHEFLKVQKDFSDWIKNQLELVGSEEGKTHTTLKGSANNGGGTKVDYILTMDVAKEICMIAGVAPRTNEETKKLSKQARQYFIAVEKAWNSPEMVMKRALEFANAKVTELQSKVKLDKPKVEFADHVATSTNSLLVREVAKIISKDGIKIGQERLYKKLREWGWVFKNSCEATQMAIEIGYMEVSETVKQLKDDKKITFKTSRVTGKGQLRIVQKLKSELGKEG